MRKNTSAFTFVELIIVLVILAILSTIGFVVYESYLSTGRDTKRIVELKNLHQNLGAFSIKSKLPLPNDKIDITSSGALVSYHGNIDDTIGKTISFKGNLYDKELDAYPVYVLGKNRKDFQLLNFVEDRSSLLESNIPRSYGFTDYQILTPTMIGKPLGVFLEDETNRPIHISENYRGNTNYDITSGTGVFNIQMSKDIAIDTSNTGGILQILPNYSCKRILEMGKSKGSGEYIISPLGNNKIQVYCEMRLDGGGWTLIGFSSPGGQKSGTHFGWLYKTGDFQDHSYAYSLGNDVKNIYFEEFGVNLYDQSMTEKIKPLKPLEYFLSVEVNHLDFMNDSAGVDAYRTGGCKVIYGLATLPTSESGLCNNYNYWGRFGYNDKFFFKHTDNTSSPHGIWDTQIFHNEGAAFDEKMGMIFIR